MSGKRQLGKKDHFKGQMPKKEYLRFAKNKCLSVEYLVMLLKYKNINKNKNIIGRY